MNPGDVVAERFEIERLAGTGGMGAVYRAKDRLSGEPVALKTLRADAGDFNRRFTREARVMMDLRHPAVVRYAAAHGETSSGEQYPSRWSGSRARISTRDSARRDSRSPRR